MGKARIIKSKGDGLFECEILRDTERATKEKESLATRLVEVDSEISSVQTEYNSYSFEVSSLQSQLDSSINSGADFNDLFELVEKIAQVTSNAIKTKAKLDSLKIEKLSIKKRDKFIDANLPAVQNADLWCADYTEQISGEVGTAEVNGDLEANPIIQPDTSANSTYNAQRDAIIQPIVSSGAPAVYFNRALFPAWQKWRPTYRIGAITAISGDLCSLTLDEAKSTQQDLVINQAQTLTGVPIDYMTQNGNVFNTGDRVLVKFESQDFANPKVIGFESNPRPEKLVYLLNTGRVNQPFPSGQHYVRRHNYDGSNGVDLFRDHEDNQDAFRLSRVGTSLFYINRSGRGSAGEDQEIFELSTSGGNPVSLVGGFIRLYAACRKYIFFSRIDFFSGDPRKYQMYRFNRDLGQVDLTFSEPEGNSYFFYEIWANEEYVYYQGETGIKKMNHDFTGLSLEVNVVALKNSNGWGSMIPIEISEDRILFYCTRPQDPPEDFIKYLAIHDLNGFAAVKVIGPLPRTQTYRQINDTKTIGDNACVFIQDNGAGNGIYIRVWERVVTRDQQGNITSEDWVYNSDIAQDIESQYSELNWDGENVCL